MYLERQPNVSAFYTGVEVSGLCPFPQRLDHLGAPSHGVSEINGRDVLQLFSYHIMLACRMRGAEASLLRHGPLSGCHMPPWTETRLFQWRQPAAEAVLPARI